MTLLGNVVQLVMSRLVVTLTPNTSYTANTSYTVVRVLSYILTGTIDGQFPVFAFILCFQLYPVLDSHALHGFLVNQN